MDWKIRKPSAEPRSFSLERSGWGIMPRTLRPSLRMPAMLSSEPLGLASAVISPSAWRSGRRCGPRASSVGEGLVVAEVVAFHVADGHLEDLAAGEAWVKGLSVVSVRRWTCLQMYLGRRCASARRAAGRLRRGSGSRCRCRGPGRRRRRTS